MNMTRLLNRWNQNIIFLQEIFGWDYSTAQIDKFNDELPPTDNIIESDDPNTRWVGCWVDHTNHGIWKAVQHYTGEHALYHPKDFVFLSFDEVERMFTILRRSRIEQKKINARKRLKDFLQKYYIDDPSMGSGDIRTAIRDIFTDIRHLADEDDISGSQLVDTFHASNDVYLEERDND